jgi:hypothetical protein
MYGFKVQLVKDCLKAGYKKIIFFDTAICLEREIDEWLALAKEHGVLSIADRRKLDAVTSNQCKKHLGLSDELLKTIDLVGGSIYVFDFETEVCQDIFNNWSYMESKGLFGTQEDCTNGNLQGHRMDETCMALALEMSGKKGLGYDLMQYAYITPDGRRTGEENPIAIKRHFK